MTDGNPRPDEEPTPPASTRWSDDTPEADDGLAPPFVPGAASTPPAAPAPDTSEETGAPAAPSAGEPAGGTTSPEEAAPDDEEAYPFETGWDEEAEPIPAGAEPEGDDFPFDAFDLEGQELEEVEDAAGEVAAPAAADEPSTEAEESFVLPEGEGAVAAPVTGPADEIADRLEAMADRLRERGPGAAEAAMGAPDRFTALLATLVAGYLSGGE